MVDPGKLPGEYNIVVRDDYDLFEHQVPVEEFKERLQENDLPDEITVSGLDGVFGDEDAVKDLSKLMDQKANSLENRNPLPTIQFAVDGSFQRLKSDFEVQVGDELYRLSQIFGPQIKRRREGWLTAPF